MRLRILLVAILMALPLWAQSGQSENAGVSLRLPSSVSGEVVPVEATPEGQRNRELESTFEMSAQCDDNALSSSKNPVSDCAYTVRPSIAFRRAGSRSSWILVYAPGFVAHHEFSQYNEMEHTLGIDAQYRFTRRLSVRVRESFVRSTNFFNGLKINPDLPTFGLVQAPNEVVALPAARRIASTSGLESTYQLSATSYVGLVVTYSDLQYEGGSGLAREQAGSAGAVYGRLVGRRHWIGLNYNFQHLRSGGSEWAVTHSLLYTHTIVLGKHLEVSAFVGPNHSQDHAPILLSPSASATLSTNWSVSAGVAVGLSTSNNNLKASVARRVTDGGGLTGPATLSSANLSFEHRLNARLSTSLSGSVGDTSPLVSNQSVSTSTSSGFRTVLLEAGCQYQVLDHINLGMDYGREWQNSSIDSASGSIHRNRVSFSIGYSFKFPLGK